MGDFISNPNQRAININKLPTDDKENFYTKIRLDALEIAMSTLTPKAFELYMYLAKNKNGFILQLSKVDFLKWTNLSESSYRRAFEELVNIGYLIPKHGTTTKYDFYELPQEEEKKGQEHLKKFRKK